MDKNEERQEKSVSVRFPVDLLEELRKVAQDNNRSINGEVLTAVRQHLAQQRRKREK